MKVLITPRSFGKYSDFAKNQLLNNGIEIINNPSGSILTEDELIALVSDVDGIIIGVDPLNERVLSHAKKLKVISKYGVGVDNIDLEYCKKHDIDVHITKNANSQAVADYAFALILALARKVTEINDACHEKDWSKKVTVDIYQKRIGILGFGNIGKAVALRARGFDMEVLAYDTYQDQAFADAHQVRFTTIDEIIETCDFISIHLPLITETQHLLNYERMSHMKKNAILVNTARGGIINEDDLVRILEEKKIYGAGLDVFQHEPASESPLLNFKNVVVGSHCAASTEGAVENMSNFAVDNLIEAFKKRGLL